MIQHELAPVGLTIQNPFGHLILWGGKRVENRDEGTAEAVDAYLRSAQGREHRGRVLLTVSKTHRLPDKRMRPYRNKAGGVPALVRQDIIAICREVAHLVTWSPSGPTTSPENLTLWGGCAIGTARIVGIEDPPAEDRGWHMAGQFGILLGDVQPMAPHGCTGAQRLWQVTTCDACKRIVAAGARHNC